MDKSTWGDGPWQIEPDNLEYTDDATGLPCRIVRLPLTGTLCGYAGVGKAHPCYGKCYSHKDMTGIEIHWGLTFSGQFSDSAFWFFGFDTGHAFDFMPAMRAHLKKYEVFLSPIPKRTMLPTEMYRDIGYVKAQVKHLAQQLSEITAAVAGAGKYLRKHMLHRPSMERRKRRKSWQ